MAFVGRKKPDWLKIKIENRAEFAFVSKIVAENNLHTICSSGKCPNMSECWNRGTATFMILGDICTRNCKFCATKSGKPLEIDQNEPVKLARSVSLMKLKHCVITSVDRDDLKDGGASHWVKVVEKVKELNAQTTVEILIPDFDAYFSLLEIVAASKADIFGHNIETVERVTPLVRSRASYEKSMKVLSFLASKGLRVKSGLMVGIGETNQEVRTTLQDLYDNGCRILTIGQYLQPTKAHIEVDRYVTPEEFDSFKEWALEIGFDYVESAPLVRSSYMAEKAMINLRETTKK
ncbi:MAG: lipoyl synthase [Rikenellaceae bacterium]